MSIKPWADRFNKGKVSGLKVVMERIRVAPSVTCMYVGSVVGRRYCNNAGFYYF